MMFKETIRKPAEAEGKYVRIVSPQRLYGHVQIRLDPAPRNSGIVLAPIDQRFFPQEYFAGVEQGLMSALASGVLARYETTDLFATVTGGSYHDVDSCHVAFVEATEMAVREALQQAECYLLEPVVRVEIKVLQEFLGTTIGELNSHRGRIEEMPNAETILASIPEIELAYVEETFVAMGAARPSFKCLGTEFDELPQSLAAQLRFCSGCERKVLPRGDSSVCPDCGGSLDSGADYSAV